MVVAMGVLPQATIKCDEATLNLILPSIGGGDCDDDDCDDGGWWFGGDACYDCGWWW